MASHSRQELLNSLTLAVDAVHAAAPRTLAEYISGPLTDEALSQLVNGLREGTYGAHWALQMSKRSQAVLRRLIVNAKTKYATYLRARDKKDVKVIWPYDSSLHTIGQFSRREIWIFVESIYKRRYTDHADCTQGRNSYKGFSAVLDTSEFEQLRRVTCEWPVWYVENVPQDFGPTISKPNLRSWEDLHLKSIEVLEDIHVQRFNTASDKFQRGNDTWFPFSNVVRKSSEKTPPTRLERGKKLDYLKDWDAGKTRDVIQRGSRPPPGPYTTRRHNVHNADGKLPPQWSRPGSQTHDFVEEEEDTRESDRHPLPITSPAISIVNQEPFVPSGFPHASPDGRYQRGRRLPPEEYRIQVSSPSSDSGDSGSVAVASLASVAGKLKRMKSFVRKPSKGEALAPVPTMAELTRPSADAFTPPSSGPLHSAIPARLQQLDIALHTPPASNSPGPYRRLGNPNRGYKRRVSSVATKKKVITPRQMRTIIHSCSSRESLQSNASSSVISRNTSATSIDIGQIPANTSAEIKVSQSSLLDSPSPIDLWLRPLHSVGQDVMRTSSGLQALSPLGQATTSVQQIDAFVDNSIVSERIAIPTPNTNKQRADSIIGKDSERVDSGNSMGHGPAVAALLDASPGQLEGVM